MRLVLTFYVWLVSLIPAVVIADGSFDEFLSNNPIESLSADGDSKQKSPVHDYDPELIADATADCAPDSIQFTGKLRARLIECPPPKTSNEEDGKNPSNKDRDETPNSSNGNNGNGKVNGHQSLKYPKKFIWEPPPPPPVLVPPASNLCPPIKSRFNVINPYLICHEGFDIEIHDGGEWIQNALWCKLSSPTSFFIGEYCLHSADEI